MSKNMFIENIQTEDGETLSLSNLPTDAQTAFNQYNERTQELIDLEQQINGLNRMVNLLESARQYDLIVAHGHLKSFLEASKAKPMEEGSHEASTQSDE